MIFFKIFIPNVFTCIVTRIKDNEKPSFHFEKSSKKSIQGLPVIISTVKIEWTRNSVKK